MAKLTRARTYLLQLVSALAGLAVSLYLLVQHTRLKNGIQGSASFCSFGKYADCDVVQTSALSEIFGFPTASIGALFYGLLFSLALLSPHNHPSFARTQRLFGRLVLAGLTVDLVLFSYQVFALKNFCLMCFVTYLATLGALYCACRLVETSSPRWISRLRQLISKQKKMSRAPRHNTLASGVALVSISAAVFLLPSYILQSAMQKRMDNTVEKFFAEFKDQRRRVIDVKPGDGTMGNSGARIRIAVFSDFECPHCRHAAFTLKTALQPYQDRVFFVFKQFPFDSSCNRLVTYRMHEHACKLARLSYCANKKNSFWDYHDKVFERASKGDHPTWENFKETISSVLSEREVTSCLSDAASLRNVQTDIDLGIQLNIPGTPAVFINGKLVTIPITVDIMRRIIEIESTLY